MAVHLLSRTALRRQIQSLRQRMPSGQKRPQSTTPLSDKKKKLPGHEETQIPVANNVPTLPFWQRLGPLTRLAQAYGRAQRSRPYVTQLCSSLVIYFAADISAQSISGSEYDPKRTGRSLTIGAISAIPSFEWCVPLSLPVFGSEY